MNEQELIDLLDPLAHAPEGTCLEQGLPGFWRVRGRTKSYGVNWNHRVCSCPHFQNRLKQGEECRHLTLLGEFLSRGDATCPLCRGEGCRSCDEKGRTSTEVYEVLLEIKLAEASAREEALKEIFR